MNPADNTGRGRRGETIACDFLVREGYTVLCRNYRAQHGEIDIIASDERYLVFVEVKSRKSRQDTRYGRPADAVNLAKRRHLTLAAEQYLREQPTTLQPRFDVIEVYTDIAVAGEASLVGAEVKHFKGAFAAQREAK